jgi:hypothetical protein
MTGNIRSILLSSDAATSLLMEMRIASIFEQHKWTAERGMYYTDPSTGKQREIDVYAAQTFDRPKRHTGTGIPLINMNVFCECKSLTGSNILLSQGALPKHSKNTVVDYWVGWDDLRKIVLEIAEQTNINEHAKIKALYDYALGRAYPDGGKALSYAITMLPPPVDLIARAFRETKSGKIDSDHTPDQSRINPLWNAIQSVFSAVAAAKTHSRDTTLSYIQQEFRFQSVDEFIGLTAFFLDAELLRSGFFHPFVVLNARLWHLNENQLDEVETARLYRALLKTLVTLLLRKRQRFDSTTLRIFERSIA